MADGGKPLVALAFSGGLDTSFCVGHLQEQGYRVATVTVDTGGFSGQQLKEIEALANKLGSIQHRSIDGRQQVFNSFGAYIIKGNILRGGVYPLCVGAERMLQAQELVKFAKEIGASAVAHGCTGAGNDQVRFDLEIRCHAPELKIIAPIRELQLSRQEEVRFLQARGIEFPASRGTYSVNQGILGTTIGGGATHDSWAGIPDEAYVGTTSPEKCSTAPAETVVQFDKGLPCRLDGSQMRPMEILLELNSRGAPYGIGRGVHIGDTTLGIKGRLAFEAPGASMLIAAHRELEKLVLTRWQTYVKDYVAQLYGMLLHEGQWSNPAMRDMEALIDSSQEFVSGEVRLRLAAGSAQVLGCRSDFSLMSGAATYGEGSSLWSGRDAEGFCKIYGIQSVLAAARGQNAR